MKVKWLTSIINIRINSKVGSYSFINSKFDLNFHCDIIEYEIITNDLEMLQFQIHYDNRSEFVTCVYTQK